MEMVWDCMDHDQVQDDTAEPQKKPFVIPVRIANGMIRGSSLLAKVMRKPPWISTKELGDSVSVRYFDNTRARDILGYVPESKLEDSIRDACRTYKARQKGGSTS